jgi:hypothetical protein
MGKAHDREHFDDYREQTHVKHEILFFTLRQRRRVY